jgi:DHA1 family multidrug resistance protein-like MFS transporter
MTALHAAGSRRSLRTTAIESLDIIRRGLPLLVIAFAVDSAFIFVFLIALQSYLPESLHASDAIAGVALAAFGGAKLVTQLASGFISDRLGARRALILGTGLLVIADVSILPLAHVAPWLIVGSAAIEGLGSSVTWPALYSAGDQRFAHGEKGRFTALLTLATGAALAVGIGGGTFLNSVASFNIAMIAPVVAVSIAFALALLLPTRGALQADPDGFSLPAFGELRTILRNSQRATFTALVLVEAAALGGLTAIFRAYGRDVLGISLAHQGLLLIPTAIVGALVVVPGGAIADRVGAKWVMVPGFALCGLCLTLLARWSDPAAVAVIAAFAGLGFGLAVPAIASTMMSLAGSTASRGGVIGWFMTMDGIGHVVGPITAGLLLAAIGAEAVLVAAGALFVIAAMIVAMSSIGEDVEARMVVVEAMAIVAEPAVRGRT